MGEGTRYRAEPAEGLIVRPLDALTLVYHRRAGATHLLAPPLPEIIEALWDGPASVDELGVRLSARFEMGEEGEVRALLAARLEELAALGLVETL